MALDIYPYEVHKWELPSLGKSGAGSEGCVRDVQSSLLIEERPPVRKVLLILLSILLALFLMI